VRQQAEAGVDLVSDGEFGKTASWSRYVVERLSGIEYRPDAAPSIAAIHGKDRRDFAEFYTEYEAAYGAAGLGRSINPVGGWAITGRVAYTGHKALARDIANLQAGLADVAVTGGFLPVVAPASVLPQRQDEHYKSEEEALFAIADALHEEYAAIVAAGLFVQIDDAFIASTYDVMVPPASLADYRKWAEVRIDALNHALRGIPEEKSRYHVCWGSWNGPHTNDVALRDIVDLILKVKVGGYSLEMANPRHEHEWRVWESVKLPEGKVLLPGVISHATNIVEHPELVAERIVRLARLVGRENVKCHRQHRLRLRPGPVRPPRAPLDPMGQTPRPRRRRSAGIKGIVADLDRPSCDRADANRVLSRMALIRHPTGALRRTDGARLRRGQCRA
jgi:5-methyltetrahydropteroyltriglutamate--homocysteine methyltransferase